ncbi:sulfite exporter TauE/SafE family protein [Pseudomonas sp. gcc21]|uniref:sulfite exporter TauE/SafE family protein n=1 Tax=Pseudomonas sp. gcc21 TaxID=2726989 RepID=UPI001451EDE4|nr:sulfite exporter TauE/SafE family protein [Pseudomonas sp. gcc21]QJD60179.1 sulfite exporter TauE/SafE family protein [Pseudomonas sp. gcc21]
MDFWHVVLIAVGGFAAGAMNALAGGGTFFSFPALLAAGIPPVSANATNAVALWPASLSAAMANRHVLRRLPLRSYLLPLMLAALIGGLAGGLVLLITTDQTFTLLIPWLLLVATLLFTFSRQLGRLVRKGEELQSENRIGSTGFVCQLLVSIYGGFFGAGMGILMIASLAISGRTEVLEINAIKNLMSSTIYSVAAITFIVAGAIHWPALLIMLVGTVSGGYAGGLFARALPDAWLRWLVIAIGWGLSLYYFYVIYA